MRCANRTQVKIGLTVARPCGPASALGTLMPRAMLSTWPRTMSLCPINLSFAGSPSRMGVGDGARGGLGEVGVDPEGIGIDERHLVLPDIGVVAELREQVGHPAVDRRADLRALEVDAGLVALGVGLRQARLGAGVLRVQRIDLPLRELQVCLGVLRRRLFLSLLGAELLRALNGAVALFR